MEKTIKCCKLDFMMIKSYLIKNIALLLVMSIFISVMNKNVIMILGMMGIYGVMVLSYPFVLQEKNGIDNFYGTLSLNRKIIVRGRYLFTIGLGILSGVISLISCIVLNKIMSFGMSIEEIAFTAAIMFGIYIVLASLQLPIYFKFGYTKAKMYAMFPIFLIPIIAVGGTTLIKDRPELIEKIKYIGTMIENNSLAFGVMIVAVVLLIMEISLIISSKFYEERKE